MAKLCATLKCDIFTHAHFQLLLVLLLEKIKKQKIDSAKYLIDINAQQLIHPYGIKMALENLNTHSRLEIPFIEFYREARNIYEWASVVSI